MRTENPRVRAPAPIALTPPRERPTGWQERAHSAEDSLLSESGAADRLAGVSTDEVELCDDDEVELIDDDCDFMLELRV